jgi:hypothetical protein
MSLLLDRSIIVSIVAYLVRIIRIGTSIQKQPNHSQMTVLSGDDNYSVSILLETDRHRMEDQKLPPHTLFRS